MVHKFLRAYKDGYYRLCNGRLPGAIRGDDERVWVVNIEHRHGQGTNVFATQRAAEKALVDYVDQYWDEEIDSAVREARRRPGTRGRVLPGDGRQRVVLLGSEACPV